MTTPAQKRGDSRQDYQTPPELLRAIARDFAVGRWTIDLAAIKANTVAPIWCGPDTSMADSLAYSWNMLSAEFFMERSINFWLNPPYADIAPWVQKCSKYQGRARIFCLVPASVGSNWFRDYVDGKAHVVAISPRVTFVGCDAPYPKDLILAVFGPVRGGFSTWRWDR